ncbi:hypothetical protein ACJX0J_014595, partial [Zea mays]
MKFDDNGDIASEFNIEKIIIYFSKIKWACILIFLLIGDAGARPDLVKVDAQIIFLMRFRAMIKKHMACAICYTNKPGHRDQYFHKDRNMFFGLISSL